MRIVWAFNSRGIRKIAALAAALVLVIAGGVYVGRQMGAQTAMASAGKEVPVYRVNRQDKKIAISFDAAWGAEKTGEILDILDQKGVKATFFLVGFWVDKYPDRVKEIAARGHEVGNHSTNHPHMSELTREQIELEVKTTGEKIAQLTGKQPVVFRPPFGDYNNLVVNTLREMNYEVIQWDVDSLDWKEIGTQDMIKRVTGKVKPGSIVLFHNNSRDICEALPTILDQLIADGYEIVPVSELLLPAPTTVDSQGEQQPATGAASASPEATAPAADRSAGVLAEGW